MTISSPFEVLIPIIGKSQFLHDPFCKEHERYLHPLEAMASQGMPATKSLARAAGVKPLCLEGISDYQMHRMAGNGMNLRCVGAFELAAMFCLLTR